MQSPTGQQGFGEVKEDEQEHPWYVKYGVRALGTFAGGLALLLGAFNIIFTVFSPTCMLFTIWQMLVGFLVITIEAPFCCAFVDQVQLITRKIEDKPLFVKAAVYVLAPLPSIIFCFGFPSFVGGGIIMGVGVLYAMIGLGKKASREEMARNAQSMGASGNTYGPQSDAKNPFSTVNLSRDPIQAAAQQWAAQSSTPKFEPPPSYSSSIPNNQNPPRMGWDMSFIGEQSQRPPNNSASLGSGSYGVNPAATSDPDNPFK